MNEFFHTIVLYTETVSGKRNIKLDGTEIYNEESRGIFEREDLDFRTTIEGAIVQLREVDDGFELIIDGQQFTSLYKKEKLEKRKAKQEKKAHNKANAKNFFESNDSESGPFGIEEHVNPEDISTPFDD